MPHVRGPNSFTESQKRLLRKQAQHRYYLKTKDKKKQQNAARYQRVKELLRPSLIPSPVVDYGNIALFTDSLKVFNEDSNR